MSVSIDRPHLNHKQRGTILLARGTVSDNGAQIATGVTATLTEQGAPSRHARIRTSIHRKNGRIEWKVTFAGPFKAPNPAPIVYDLVVTPWYGRTKGTAVPYQFKLTDLSLLKGDELASTTSPSALNILMTHPAGNITITESEAETFIAFGTLQNDCSLVSAVWGSTVADFIFDDGQTWVAQFPGKAANTSDTVVVFDSANPPHTDSRKVTVIPD